MLVKLFKLKRKIDSVYFLNLFFFIYLFSVLLLKKDLMQATFLSAQPDIV